MVKNHYSWKKIGSNFLMFLGNDVDYYCGRRTQKYIKEKNVQVKAFLFMHTYIQ